MVERMNIKLELVKKAAAEEIWLHYFNRVLFETGVITEQERNRMSNCIDDRAGSHKKCDA